MQFRTSFVKATVTLVLLVVFVLLGFWQLDRSAEKSLIRDQVRARAEMPELEIGGVPLDTDGAVYRSAMATGRYLHEFQILLDNMVHRGQAGFHVLTPLLLLDTDTLILINRGWAPWGPSRQQVPDIGAADGLVSVSGLLVPPLRHAVTFEDTRDGPDFEPVWQNLDVDAFERLTGYAVHGLILQLAPGESDVGGLIREWPKFTDAWIERHRAYAWQWFGLAVTLACIFLVFSLKRRVG